MRVLLALLLSGSVGYNIYLFRRIDMLLEDRAGLLQALAETRGQLNTESQRRTALEAQLGKTQAALTELQRRGNVVYRLTASVTLNCVATEPDTVRERLGSTKLGTVISFVLANGTAHRFTNREFVADTEEFEGGRFSITFVYQPEVERLFFGQQIDVLARVAKVRVNYAPVLNFLGLQLPGGSTLSRLHLSVNDVEVVSLLELTPESGNLASGEAVFDVEQAFANVTSRYTEGIQGGIQN